MPLFVYDPVTLRHSKMVHEKEAELQTINTKENESVYSESKHELYSNKLSPFQRQALISFGTFMLTLSAGATAGFSAVLIPQLQNAEENKYSTEMVSWVAAISSLALLFGNLMSGYLMERFGRRTSQIMLSIPFVGGWVIIALAKNISIILIGRFITGLCQGWLGPLGPVFVGEISSPTYRGFFLAALSLAIATGVLMSHIFGSLFHWSIASLLCGIFPFIGGIILFYAYESPVWLAHKCRINKSVTSFQWYRGVDSAMKLELDKMISEQTKRDKTKSKIKTLATNIRKPEFWKPLCIMTTFFVITQLTGVNVICAYTTVLMKELIGADTNTYMAMISIDVLRCVSLAISCVLLRKVGRRTMAIVSGVFTSISLVALAVYLYLVKVHVFNQILSFISLGLMVIYMIFSNLGVIPLPWNMVGEVFATETKGIGSGISVMMTSVAFFGTVKSAPAMFQCIGHHGAYLFYGLSTLLGTIFLYFFLPETKDKTLLQIEEYFRHDRSRKTKKGRNNLLSI